MTDVTKSCGLTVGIYLVEYPTSLASKKSILQMQLDYLLPFQPLPGRSENVIVKSADEALMKRSVADGRTM